MPLPAALAARLAKRGLITSTDRTDIPGKHNLKITFKTVYLLTFSKNLIENV